MKLVILLFIFFFKFSREENKLLLNVPSEILSVDDYFVNLNLDDIVVGTNERLRIILTEFSGEGDMRATIFRNGQITDQVFSTEDVDFKFVEISSQGASQIGVQVEVFSNGPFEFSVLAKKTDDTTLLGYNNPQNDKVKKDGLEFYSYTSLRNEQIQISVTTIAGENDLYVSKGKRPSVEEFEHSKKNYETRNVIIDSKKGDKHYIGIHGVQSSFFQISVRIIGGSSVLGHGVPLLTNMKYNQIDYIYYHHSNEFEDMALYFNAYVLYHCKVSLKMKHSDGGYVWQQEVFGDTNKNSFFISFKDKNFKKGVYRMEVRSYCEDLISFFIQSKRGDNVLLMNGFPFKNFEKDGAEKFVTFKKYTFGGASESVHVHSTEESGLSLYGSDECNPNKEQHKYKGVPIESTMMLQIPQTEKGLYFFSVSNVGGLVVSSSDSNVRYKYLLDSSKTGISISKGQFHYFSFEIDLFNGFDNEIIVKTVEGDVAVYASMLDKQPSRESYDWKSNIPGSGVINMILIPYDHKLINSLSFKGKLYVSVFAFKNSKFTIEAKYKDIIEEVHHNIPIVDTIAYTEVKYYKYKYPYDGKSVLQLKAAENICYAAVYLSRNYKPVTERSQYFKNVLTDIQHLEFDNSPDWWIIAVIGKSEKCKFEMTLSEKYGIVNDFGSYHGFVLKDQCRSFKLPITDHFKSNIQIGSTLVSGNVVTYLKRGSLPTPKSYDFKDEKYFGNLIVDANGVDDYWISVCGKLNSTYSLHSSFKSNFAAKLELTHPSLVRAFKDKMNFAYAFPPVGTSNFRISAISRNEGVDVYISQTENPGPSQMQWKLSLGPFEFKHVSIKGFKPNTPFYIGFISKEKDGRFVMLMEEMDQALGLFAQEEMLFDTVENDQVFKFRTPVYDSELNVRMDSCVDKAMPNFFLKKYVAATEISFISRAKNGFSTEISTTTHDQNQDYYLFPQPGFSHEKFSIDVTHVNDPRPKPANKVIKYKLVNDEVKVFFSEVSNPSQGLKYHVFRRKVSPKITQEQLKNLNVYTTCAARLNADNIGEGAKDPEHHGYFSYQTKLLAPDHIESFAIVPFDSEYGFGEIYDSIYPTVVEIGKPKHAIVDKGQEINLLLPQLSNGMIKKKLIIALTHYTGLTQLHVGKNTGGSDWISNEFGIVEIDVNEQTLGTFFLKIQAHEDADFAIHAYVEDQENIIKDSYPQLMKTNERTHIKFLMDKRESFYISMVPIVDHPLVYFGKKGVLEVEFDVIEVSDVNVGNYYDLAVQKKEDHSIYYMSISSKSSSTKMVEGIPIGGKISKKGEFRYYQFNLLDIGEFLVTITPIYGNVVVFGSTKTTTPNEESHEFKSMDNVLKITPSGQMIYYFSVQSASVDVFYHMTISYSSRNQFMLNGLPKVMYKEEKNNLKFFIETRMTKSSLVAIPKKKVTSKFKVNCGDVMSTSFGSLEIIDLDDSAGKMLQCSISSGDKDDYIMSLTSMEKTPMLYKGMSSFGIPIPEYYHKRFLVFTDNQKVMLSVYPNEGEVRIQLSDSSKVIWESFGNDFSFYSEEIKENKLYLDIYGLTSAKITIVNHQTDVENNLLINPSPFYSADDKAFSFSSNGKDERIKFSMHPFGECPGFTVGNVESKRYGTDYLEIEKSEVGKYQVGINGKNHVGLVSIAKDYEFLMKNDYSAMVNNTDASVKKFKFFVEEGDGDIFVDIQHISGSRNLTILVNPSDTFPTMEKFAFGSRKKSIFIPQDDKKYKLGTWSVIIITKGKPIKPSYYWLTVKRTMLESKLFFGMPSMGYMIPYAYGNGVISASNYVLRVKDEKRLTFNIKEDRYPKEPSTIKLLIGTKRNPTSTNEDSYEKIFKFEKTRIPNLFVTFENDIVRDGLLYFAIEGRQHQKVHVRVSHEESHNYMMKFEEIVMTEETGKFALHAPRKDEKNNEKITSEMIVRVESCNARVPSIKLSAPEEVGSKWMIREKSEKENKFHQDFIIEPKNHDSIYPFSYTNENNNHQVSIRYLEEDDIPKIGDSNIIVSNVYSYSTLFSKGYKVTIPVMIPKDYVVTKEDKYDIQFDNSTLPLHFFFSKFQYVMYVFQSSNDLSSFNFHTRCGLRSFYQYENSNSHSKVSDESLHLKRMLLNENNTVFKYDYRRINGNGYRGDKGDVDYKYIHGHLEVYVNLKSSLYTAVNVIMRDVYQHGMGYNNIHAAENIYVPNYFYSNLGLLQYTIIAGAMGITLFVLCLAVVSVFLFCKFGHKCWSICFNFIKRKKKKFDRLNFIVRNNKKEFDEDKSLIKETEDEEEIDESNEDIFYDEQSYKNKLEDYDSDSDSDFESIEDDFIFMDDEEISEEEKEKVAKIQIEVEEVFQKIPKSVLNTSVNISKFNGNVGMNEIEKYIESESKTKNLLNDEDDLFMEENKLGTREDFMDEEILSVLIQMNKEQYKEDVQIEQEEEEEVIVEVEKEEIDYGNLRKKYKNHHKHDDLLLEVKYKFDDKKFVKYGNCLKRLTPRLLFEISSYVKPKENIKRVIRAVLLLLNYPESIVFNEFKYRAILKSRPLHCYDRIIRFDPKRCSKEQYRKAKKVMSGITFKKADKLSLPTKILYSFVQISLHLTKKVQKKK